MDLGTWRLGSDQGTDGARPKMAQDVTRRDLMRRSIAAGGLFAVESLMLASSTSADQVAVTQSESRVPATIAGDKVVQPRREVPVLHQTSILIVGGGPAGTAAAFCAKRLGVDVTLVERYGYLGGLATGGLVLGIFPLYDRNNRQVIFGVGEELMKKLDVLKYGIIDRNKAPVYPTIDAEAFKTLVRAAVARNLSSGR